jgi:hypothetical protein
MTTLDVPSLDTTELRVTVAAHDAAGTQGTIEITMVGSAEAAAVEPLAVLLRRLRDEATRVHPREVVVDLRALEFMNSACFKSFVTWLAELQEVDADKQYTIRFRSDPAKHWQRRSLDALSRFAADLVKVDA